VKEVGAAELGKGFLAAVGILPRKRISAAALGELNLANDI